MKYRVLFLSLFLLMSSSIVLAQNNLNFTVKPKLSRVTGHTRYTIEMTDYVSLDGVNYLGGFKSTLNFPLNSFMIGGELDLWKNDSNNINWSFSFMFLTNVFNPGKSMSDEDWIRAGFSYLEYSYTESNFDLRNTVIKLNWKKRIYSKNKDNIYLMGGFRYQKITQNITDFSGWQLDLNDPDLKRYEFDSTVNALYYKITYKMPYLGLMYNINPNSRVAYELGAAYMLTFVSDFDDHLLRFKTATSDGTGHGVLALLNINYLFENKLLSGIPFLCLGGELIYTHISTEQTQKWYGDDPAQEGDETDLMVDDIPNKITSFQLDINLSLGLKF